MDVIKPTYTEFLRELKHKADLCGLNFEVVDTLFYRKVTGEKLEYPYARLTSKDLSKPILLIRAAIHGGHEYAGALTILKNLERIASYAEEKGVALVIFPMDNPSGYENGSRHNVENDSGHKGVGGNNDGVRYILSSGEIADGLKMGQEYSSWRWASDPSLKLHLPEETIVFHRELRKLPLHNVRAFLDIHQDKYQKSQGTYFYAYGDITRYAKVVQRIEEEKQLPIFRNMELMSWATEEYYKDFPEDEKGKVDPLMTDSFGCVTRKDASCADLLLLLGADHVVTPETGAGASFEACDSVNMAWIEGLMDIVTDENMAWPPLD